MLALFALPSFAEDFYTRLGNDAMAYKFISREVKADGGADTGRLLRATNLAISLSEEDESYAGDVEEFIEILLDKDGIDDRLSEIDAFNIENLLPKFHPNFYSQKDYYVNVLYSVKLDKGETDLLVGDKYVSIAEFIGGEYGYADEDITAINQLAQYLEAGGEITYDGSAQDGAIQLALVINRAKEKALDGFDINAPTLQKLFAIKSLRDFAYYASDVSEEFGKVENSALYGDCKNFTELYKTALNKYAQNYYKD